MTTGDVAGPRGHRLGDSFVALPNASAPRYLVPDGDRAAMAAALRHHSSMSSMATRWARRGLAGASRAGAVGHLLGEPIRVWVPPTTGTVAASAGAFADLLRDELGRPDARVALSVRRIDAHYKPTIGLFSPQGAPLAFAKLGWTPGTGALVRRETAALLEQRGRGGSTSEVSPPMVARSGTWRGMPYVATRPLPSNLRPVDDADPQPGANRQVAGSLVDSTLTTSPWWATARSRLDGVPTRSRPLVSALGDAARTLAGRHGSDIWRFGAWHGDWVPWNMGHRANRLYVWDWEHSAPSAPAGFDLLHWWVTTDHLRRGVPYGRAIRTALRAVPRPHPAPSSTAFGLAYLLEMGLRSLALGDGPGGGRDELYLGLTAELEWWEAACRRGQDVEGTAW